MSESGVVMVARRSIDRDLRRNFAQVRRFFPGGDPRHVTVALPERTDGLHRYLSGDTLAALREHNDAFSCGDVTLNNIDLLDHADVSVILATHRPCFLTGPLQVIYKALTCVQLSAYCRETLGLRTVPVFWLAGTAPQSQDAREIRFVNADDRIVALNYEPAHYESYGPVGTVPLEEQVDFLLRLLARDTAHTNNKRYLTDLLLSTRERSRTLGEWTARLLHALFHIYGLVVVDETQPYATAQTVRCLSEPFAWGTRPGRAIADAARELQEANYGGTLEVDEDAAPFAFFGPEGIERWTVEGQAFTGPGGRTLEADAMRDELASRRSHLTVVDWLRPVIQARWLPVLALVADPHEIRVAAHLPALFESAVVPMPLVYPRARVLLMERHVQRLLDKYDVALTDFVHPRKALTDKTLEKDLPRPVVQACDRKLDMLQAVLDELREEVLESNPEQVDHVDGLKRQIGLGMDALRHSLLEAKTESPFVVSANLERIRAHLFPEGKPQERMLNVFPFLFTHGIELISRLSSELDVFNFDVQTVRL